jgi:hypothetical protein
MKKFISLSIIGTMLTYSASTMETRVNDYEYVVDQPLTEDSSTEAIGVSMLGWGIGLAAAIAILAGVLKQNKGRASTSPTQ